MIGFRQILKPVWKGDRSLKTTVCPVLSKGEGQEDGRLKWVFGSWQTEASFRSTGLAANWVQTAGRCPPSPPPPKSLEEPPGLMDFVLAWRVGSIC